MPPRPPELEPFRDVVARLVARAVEAQREQDAAEIARLEAAVVALLERVEKLEGRAA